MSDKKHIDRLFQESFKDFEAEPNNAVWKRIEAELNKDKKKRRVIPIWWRYAGVAALLLLLFTVGSLLFNDSENIPENQVVDTEVETPINSTNNNNLLNNEAQNAVVVNDSELENEDSSSTQNELENNDALNTTLNNHNRSSVANNRSASNDNLIVSDEDELDNDNNSITNNSKNVSENNTVIANNTSTENKTSLENSSAIDNEKVKNAITNATENTSAIAETKEEENNPIIEDKTSNNTTIEDAIDKTNKINEEEKRQLNRWSVAANAAPVYFNSLGEGSSIDPQFTNNAKSGDLNMSYGIKASYALNDRLSIRSGINKVNLSQNTNDVIVYQSTGISRSFNLLQNVTPTNSSANDAVSVISEESITSQSPEFLSASSTTSLNQAMGYIEIPLEVEYALLNKKFGINVIGGFSSLFLQKNEIYSTLEGSRTLLGEANNINKVSYSANFGLGFNYQVSKKLELNLEPMFKYQINTFNNTSGNFSPYFIGVYTGFAIKF